MPPGLLPIIVVLLIGAAACWLLAEFASGVLAAIAAIVVAIVVLVMVFQWAQAQSGGGP